MSETPPHPPGSPAAAQGMAELRRFLRADSGARVFSWPISHPSRPTGFCPCDRSLPARGWFYLKSALLLAVLKLPFNSPKLTLLRWFGAKVGRQVYISADVWIDPAFVPLLTIEDEVMIGVGVKIALHEFTRDRFQAGRVSIRRGAVIGGFALIRHGVEIGENAVVAGAAAVGRDVPAGKLAIGNPARIVAAAGPHNRPSGEPILEP